MKRMLAGVFLETAYQRNKRLSLKISTIELGHMTVRISNVRRTIMCYGKMLHKDERTLTNKKCLPLILETLALMPERKGDAWNILGGKTRGQVVLPTSPM
jgi:hypothetical protein